MDDGLAIARSLRGDPSAFRHLVERYERQAFAHAVGITGDRATAQDAVQDALVDAWRSLARFDQRRPFYPWLYTLLRNRCFKALGARRGSTPPDGVELLAPSAGAVDDTLDLERALARLAPEDRELLLLRHLDGLSYEELAERIGVPPGTVASRLHHARANLKDAMGPPQGEGAKATNQPERRTSQSDEGAGR